MDFLPKLEQLQRDLIEKETECKKLEIQLRESNSKNESLSNELNDCRLVMFQTNEDSKKSRDEVSKSKKLEEDYVKLMDSYLDLSERYNLYKQSQYDGYLAKTNAINNYECFVTSESMKHELVDCKSELCRKQAEISLISARLRNMEEVSCMKEKCISELKKSLDDAKVTHMHEIRVLQEYIQSLKNTIISYETMLASYLNYQESRSECTDVDLAQLYASGLSSMQEALKKDGGDIKQNLLIEARRSLERADDLVESLALFSDNETIDDVATSNIKYLLIPAYLAKLHISGDISTQRLEAFTRAEYHMRRFLSRVSLYRIGGERVDQLIKEASESTQLGSHKTLEDQAQIRRDKIDHFNESKKLELRLADMERRLESEADEELVREYNMDLMIKWINDTLDDLNGIVEPALMFERGDKSAVSGDSMESKPSGSSISNNFIIIKDKLQDQVFGAGYPSLPTVSVDEFMTKKMNDGDLVFQKDKQIYSNSLQRYAEKPNLLREQEEQSDEEREAKGERDDQDELTRKRRWDEFKDDNPRGSGNRHNMG